MKVALYSVLQIKMNTGTLYRESPNSQLVSQIGHKELCRQGHSQTTFLASFDHLPTITTTQVDIFYHYQQWQIVNIFGLPTHLSLSTQFVNVPLSRMNNEQGIPEFGRNSKKSIKVVMACQLIPLLVRYQWYNQSDNFL